MKLLNNLLSLVEKNKQLISLVLVVIILFNLFRNNNKEGMFGLPSGSSSPIDCVISGECGPQVSSAWGKLVTGWQNAVYGLGDSVTMPGNNLPSPVQSFLKCAGEKGTFVGCGINTLTNKGMDETNQLLEMTKNYVDEKFKLKKLGNFYQISWLPKCMANLGPSAEAATGDCKLPIKMPFKIPVHYKPPHINDNGHNGPHITSKPKLPNLHGYSKPNLHTKPHYSLMDTKSQPQVLKHNVVKNKPVKDKDNKQDKTKDNKHKSN